MARFPVAGVARGHSTMCTLAPDLCDGGDQVRALVTLVMSY